MDTFKSLFLFIFPCSALTGWIHAPQICAKLFDYHSVTWELQWKIANLTLYFTWSMSVISDMIVSLMLDFIFPNPKIFVYFLFK